MRAHKVVWQYHTCDECGDRYPSYKNSMPPTWSFDAITGRLICDACRAASVLANPQNTNEVPDD